MANDPTLFRIDGLDAILCTTSSAQARAFHLRYRAFRAARMIADHAAQVVCDAYDASAHHRTFLITDGALPVATVRSGIYSPLYGWSTTETLLSFRGALGQYFDRNVRFVELSRRAVEPAVDRATARRAEMLCFQLLCLDAVVHGCEHVVAGVRAPDISDYRRRLGLKPVLNTPRVRAWPDQPMALMTAPIKHARRVAVAHGMPTYDEADVRAFWTAASRSTKPVQAQARNEALAKMAG